MHIDKQKPGTIDIYEQVTDDFDEDGNNVTIKVAVEFIGDNVGKASKMFFGKAAQSTQSSKWVCNEYHHLEKPLINYKIYYRILYKYNRFSFMICLLKDPNSKEPFVYIYPSENERKVKRFVNQDFSTDPLNTEYLTIVTKYDKLVLEMINANKVCFSDNLTGTRFYSIKKERGSL